jgi:sec-independent protein translocase protein TatC
MSFVDEADDFFRDTRMSLGDHIEELRRHLLRALLGLAVAVAVGFFLCRPLLEVITGPVERELLAFHERRLRALEQRLATGDPRLAEADRPCELPIQVRRGELRGALGLAEEAGGDEWVALNARLSPLRLALASGKAQHQLRRPSLAALTVTEPFTVYFKVSVYCGLVLASPWVFYQLWAFVAAGLYPHEKRWVYGSLPLSVGLFLAGVALCQFVVLPAGVAYLLSYHEWLGVEPDLRLSDWLNFALVLPLVFGACFQTPLVMLVLDRVGLVGADAYRRNRRLAAFLLVVLAAVVTPTPDFVNLLALAVPLYALYEAGILLCRFVPQPAEVEDGQPAVAP